jgi:flagellar biosynthesis GTPase FlhF
MKILDEFNQHAEKDLFQSFKEEVLDQLRSNIKEMKEAYKDQMEKIMENVNFENENASFKQQDFLRCRGYFPTREKLFEAIDALKTHPKCKLIRIKNRD